jgi:hypothetical protein
MIPVKNIRFDSVGGDHMKKNLTDFAARQGQS